jgi:hypothetical protein
MKFFLDTDPLTDVGLARFLKDWEQVKTLKE